MTFSAPPLLLDTLRAYSADRAERLAAALAYYATFSFAPLLVVILAVVRLAYSRQSEAVRADLMAGATDLFGPDGATLLKGLLEGAASSPNAGLWAALVAGAVLVFGATALVARLQEALNTIWDATPQEAGVWGFLWSRTRSLLLIVGAGALLVGSLVIQSLLTGLADTFAAPTLLRIGGPMASFALLVLLFAVLYRTLPDAPVRWSDVWPGAAVTAVLVTLGTWGVGWYLGYASVTSSYGAAGTLAAFLLWVYYTAQIFLLGAEFIVTYSAPSPTPSPSPPSPASAMDAEPSPSLSWARRLGWVVLGILLGRFFRRS